MVNTLTVIPGQPFGEYEILQEFLIFNEFNPKGKIETPDPLRETRAVCKTNVKLKRIKRVAFLEHFKLYGRNYDMNHIKDIK